MRRHIAPERPPRSPAATAPPRAPTWRDGSPVSAGGWIVLLLALASTLAFALCRPPETTGREMWTFARPHALIYQPVIAQWNRTHQPPIILHVLGTDALGRRMMSGFLAHTPVADLIELERNQIGRAFSGPLDDIGFVDLTDRLRRDGLLDQMNAPSFSPWTSRGHIFGLPHDVHPVMLAYRTDLIDAAGIDVSRIHTWADFAREMRPLLLHRDIDGQPDRYPLNLWTTSIDQVEALVLQAGGGYFDELNNVTIDSDINAHVVATIISWTVGPDRIAADAPEFTASGNELRARGYIACTIAPDWMTGIWKTDLPQLAGKVKLMPLPAWEPGGKRTSVWGGTMLGIAKTSTDVEGAWAFARALYLNDDVARRLYETNGIISPVKRLWSSSFYDQPDPFFCGQAPGRLYIQLAPDVPRRTSSPYNSLAKLRVQDAMVALREFALAYHAYSPASLFAETHRRLRIAQEEVQRQVQRNVFLRENPS